VLATTHYSGLKMYAANEDAVVNASVEFDEKTLQPTYRLLVGVAGASSGIEIARRFGFPDEIVSTAQEHVGESSREATQYLRRHSFTNAECAATATVAPRARRA